MKIFRAKHKQNKLQVEDNRPFAIDKVELLEKGFTVFFTDLTTGQQHALGYASRELFDNEWEFCKGIKYKKEVFECYYDD